MARSNAPFTCVRHCIRIRCMRSVGRARKTEIIINVIICFRRDDLTTVSRYFRKLIAYTEYRSVLNIIVRCVCFHPVRNAYYCSRPFSRATYARSVSMFYGQYPRRSLTRCPIHRWRHRLRTRCSNVLTSSPS